MTLPTSSPTLETLLNHRSIRKFSDKPIAEDLLATIIEAGQMASSSSFMQAVSIIRVTDKQLRQHIRKICVQQPQTASPDTLKGHEYVGDCAEFLVFCMDNQRHQQLVPDSQLDWAEVVLIGAIDAGLVAQNVMVAAESVGLGGVYIGSIRNDLATLSDLLKLPPYVVPLFGMCLGYPEQNPVKRPRLPLTMLLSTNHYEPATTEQLEQYNQVVANYYHERGNDGLDWQKQIANTFAKPVRPAILPYLQSQGYAKR